LVGEVAGRGVSVLGVVLRMEYSYMAQIPVPVPTSRTAWGFLIGAWKSLLSLRSSIMWWFRSSESLCFSSLGCLGVLNSYRWYFGS